MKYNKSILSLLAGFIFCIGFIETTNAQQNSNYLPKYSIKSAVIQYNLKADVGNDTESHPSFRETFDAYGSVILKERIDELTLQLLGEPYQKLYRDGYVYSLNDPKDCVTKHKIKGSEYMDEFDGGFIRKAQDLIHNKINKSATKNFIRFTKTGETSFLNRNCSVYEYIEANPAYLSENKYIYIVYQDICLSMKTFFLGTQISTFEATSFEENIQIPQSTFEVPSKYRLIDGDKLDGTYKEASSGFSTLIVNYTTKRDYGQVKETGKKTVYIRDSGKASAQDWEGTTEEFGLHPEAKHIKKIRDEDDEFLINFIAKTVSRRDLVKGNYNDKSFAELNYLFENKLYDTSVKELGKTIFLGKSCTIFEIKTGIEKLEVYAWQGVYLKVLQYISTDGKDFILIGEEIATSVQENVSIANSLFEYPEDFSRN